MIDSHNSIGEKFLKKGLVLYLFSFIIAPIGYIIKIIISGEVSVSELGILYGVMSLVFLLSSFSDFGMAESIKYFIPKYEAKKQYHTIKNILGYAFITQIVTGLIIAGILFFTSGYIADNYFKTQQANHVIQVFSLYFLAINVFQVLNTFFLAIQKTFYHKITAFFQSIGALTFVLYTFFSGHSSVIQYAFSWVFGLYLGVMLVIYIFYTRYYRVYFSQEKFSFDSTLIKKLFSYSFMVFLSAQAGTILGQIDMQMIIYLLGTQDAGYYSTYLSIITIPFLLIGPIFAFLLPVFSELHSKGQDDKIKTIKHVFQKNFTAVAIALNILFFVFALPIAYILFGEKYIPSGHILQYSILFLVFNFLLQINFNILGSIGKITTRLKIVLAAIVVNAILNIVFIHLIGVAGAALATALGWVLIFTLSEISLRKKYAGHINILFLVKNILVMGILGTAGNYYILPFFTDLSRIKSFILFAGISVLWFAFFLAINTNEVKYFIREIKKVRGK